MFWQKEKKYGSWFIGCGSESMNAIRMIREARGARRVGVAVSRGRFRADKSWHGPASEQPAADSSHWIWMRFDRPKWRDFGCGPHGTQNLSSRSSSHGPRRKKRRPCLSSLAQSCDWNRVTSTLTRPAPEPVALLLLLLKAAGLQPALRLFARTSFPRRIKMQHGHVR